MKKLTYENIAHAKELNVYLEQGNRVLDALGYTDHSQKHTAKVAVTAGKILKKLGYDTHTVELVRIAGYMYDLGNSINRVDHAHTGALMAFQFLRDWGAPPEDIAAIISAIGQHDERSGIAFDPISAALILADKSDVRRDRVRNTVPETFDKYDLKYIEEKGIMHMLRYGKGTFLATVMAGLLTLSLITAGCGSRTQTKSAAVSVKAMKVLQQDTAVSHDYSGQIKSTNAVTIKPRVSGEIVEKYFTSGAPVEKGQPLYKIDDRQYESEVLSAKSNVDKARTTLNNSLVDLNRYQQLAASGAVAEQTLTNQQATVDSNRSSYDDANALLQKAQENLDDTIIRAPISGKLSVDDVPSGTYVTAGNTALVSVGSINPIYVQFLHQ